MSYAALMVHVGIDAEPGGELDERVGVAADLAERFHAHLIGITGWAPMSLFLAEDGSNDAAQLDSRRQDMKTLLDEKGKQFRAAVQKVDDRAEWRSALELPTEFVAREARAADLIIIGNERENRSQFRSLDAGSFLLKAGRPVLVVPKGVASLSPKHVAIAWKDTREARRAVADALPFLQAAENVMIVEVIESGRDQTPNGIKDVAYLARHGIEIVAERQWPAEVTAANSLLRLIEVENINLIVAGAYGHSRLGEWAYGGVTRDLLLECPVCCLFAH